MLNRKLVAVGLGALLTLPAFGQEDLRSKVEDLEQQLKILKRQLELDKEASTEKARTTSVFSAGANGFTFRSADTNFVLKVRGYVQADARFYPDDVAGGTANDTFLMRRVRPILEGTVFEKFDYRVMLDLGSNNSLTPPNNGLLQDAYFTARFKPWFQVVGGKLKEPVSQERLQSGSNLLFVERPYTAQIAPNRDVGFLIQGDLFDSSLNYSVGYFNGVADGGSGDLETSDDDKDIVGRVFSTPFKASKIQALEGLGLGVAGTFGSHDGALRGYSSAGQQPIFAFGYPAAGAVPAVTVVADGNTWRLAPQGYYYYGPFGLLGEYVVSEQTVRRGATTTGVLRNRAWTVSASYFLTGEDNSFKAVTPKRPFNPAEGAWGAIELAARVQGLDIDDDAFPTFANPATAVTGAYTWGLGANWHLNKNFKVNLNYEQTDFNDGTTSFLKHGEKVVFTRAQFSF